MIETETTLDDFQLKYEYKNIDDFPASSIETSSTSRKGF